MTTPEVSVVVPFLNARPFMEESIASVRAQTYPHWELLLVDDGSRDGGAEIARAHATRDPERVRYFEHPGHARRGASAARNVGIRHARGRYLAFLDADDVWLPGKLTSQLAIIEAHPEAAMIYNRTQYWYSWTGTAEDGPRDFIERLGVPSNTLIAPPRLLTLILRRQAPVPCTCSVLIRRSAVERVGGFEESFIDLFTDQAFYAKIFLNLPVFAADGCWDRYRQHPDQSCADAERTGRIRVARREFLEWLERYLIEHGARGTDVWQALGHALEPYRSERDASVAGRSGALKRRVRWLARRALPASAQDWLRRRWRGPAYTPPVGRLRWGDLRRKTPVSDNWGIGRGLPVDRYYIEQFLARHAGDIHGRVVEVGDDRYTRKFGGVAVTASDVLNVAPGHPQTTIVADLARPEQVPSGCFDCVIITQTFQLLADLEGTVRTLHGMLRPGGVVLATLPGISQTHHEDWGGHWRWNFTALSARTLFESAFPPEDVTVATRGNVLVATALLQGLVVEDLRPDELDHDDRDYQVSILVRARKAGRAE
jgi:glycosyltransferase involved in cell wall biosynthesis